MKTVGYFEGTDSGLLTTIVANGFCTLPLANEWDGHGKEASLIEPNEVDLIIGYLHKVMPPLKMRKDTKELLPLTDDEYRGIRPSDLLYRAKAYNIQVFIIVPEEYHDEAKRLLGEASECVTLVNPDDLEKKVREYLRF